MLTLLPTPPSPGADNYEARTLGVASQAATSVDLFAFCSESRCCAIAYCNDARGCGTSSITLEYTPPSAAPCSINNRGPVSAFAGNYFTGSSSCLNGQGLSQALTLSNPNNHLMCVW